MDGVAHGIVVTVKVNISANVKIKVNINVNVNAMVMLIVMVMVMVMLNGRVRGPLQPAQLYSERSVCSAAILACTSHHYYPRQGLGLQI